MIRNIYAGLTEGDSAQKNRKRASECQLHWEDKKVNIHSLPVLSESSVFLLPIARQILHHLRLVQVPALLTLNLISCLLHRQIFLTLLTKI